MSIMLPGEASKLLNELGFEWPEGDEDKIFNYGSRWMSFAGDMGGVVQTATDGANQATQQGIGQAVEAFKASYSKAEGVDDVAKKMQFGGNMMGGCLMLVGGAVIALKITFVVNLVATVIQIVEAIAAAVPTCGASLAWIPAAKIICQKLLEMAINFAVNKLMGA